MARPSPRSAQRHRLRAAGFALWLALAAACALPTEPQQYRVVTDLAESARPVALEMLKHLASGELEAAAALSNAPQRRLEVLRAYRDRVGEVQFRQLFARYFAPGNHILMEAAIGAHRLVVWDLADAGGRLAGQYLVAVEGRFLVDDVPSPERAKLQRVLAQLRSSR